MACNPFMSKTECQGEAFWPSLFPDVHIFNLWISFFPGRGCSISWDPSPQSCTPNTGFKPWWELGPSIYKVLCFMQPSSSVLTHFTYLSICCDIWQPELRNMTSFGQSDQTSICTVCRLTSGCCAWNISPASYQNILYRFPVNIFPLASLQNIRASL